jgi:hypothetical protein
MSPEDRASKIIKDAFSLGVAHFIRPRDITKVLIIIKIILREILKSI